MANPHTCCTDRFSANARRRDENASPGRPPVQDFSLPSTVALKLRRDLPLLSPPVLPIIFIVLFLCAEAACCLPILYTLDHAAPLRLRLFTPYVTAYRPGRHLPHCASPAQSAGHTRRCLDTSPSTDHPLDITNGRALGSSLCTSISPSVVRRPPLPQLRATPARGSHVVELHPLLGTPSPISCARLLSPPTRSRAPSPSHTLHQQPPTPCP